MSHYFSEDNNTLKSNPKEIAFRVNGIDLKMVTDIGVFAKDGFDRGTKILLDYAEFDPNMKTVLDLGCGYGVIGIYINKKYGTSVDMIDINKRAIDLSNQNIKLNNAKANCFQSEGFKNVSGSYDCIITNPPIRVGKKIMYELFSNAHAYLNDKGRLLLVINKKHGALSAKKFLEELFNEVTILGKNKGFYVLLCKK